MSENKNTPAAATGANLTHSQQKRNFCNYIKTTTVSQLNVIKKYTLRVS